MSTRCLAALVLGAAFSLVFSGCVSSQEKLTSPQISPSPPNLVGAWRSRVQFENGSFAGVNSLEFMYVFNDGGTMTESSNYDAAPPVPPAYGIWRRTSQREFEAKYCFYTTTAPARLDQISTAGWSPAGHGELIERIYMSADGASFTSKVSLQLFDMNGRAVEGGGSASGTARRIQF
jgi:hypothetical protein